MSRFSTSRALVVDLELTCWDGPPPDGMRPEIIEIGIVEIDAKALAITRSTSCLTLPVRSTISEYCTELTGITPERMKREGRPFPEVLRTLMRAYGPSRKSLITWGDDWSPIEAACGEYEVDNPFPAMGVLDIGRMASLVLGEDRRPGLSEILVRLGLHPEGRRHSAEGDAVDTARVFCAIAGRMR